jgi:hypothetical protein
MEGTVLRVACIVSSRRRGFWRSPVRSVGPPSLNVGPSRPQPAGARHKLSRVCALLKIAAAPRHGRAARRTLGCAPALNAVPHAVLRRRARDALAVRWCRVGSAPVSGLVIELIAANLTRAAGDVSTSFWDVCNVPKRPTERFRVAHLSSAGEVIAHNLDPRVGRLHRHLRFTGLSKRPLTSRRDVGDGYRVLTMERDALAAACWRLEDGYGPRMIAADASGGRHLGELDFAWLRSAIR